MEGEGVSALKSAFFFFLSTFLALSAHAQSGSFQWENITIVEEPFHWTQEPGLFLEPNRFSVVKELQDRPLWLEVGFGKPVLDFLQPNGNIDIGLEALAWSRLETLPDFRFPVETLDYFFGLYAIWDRTDYERAHVKGISRVGDSWRLRIGHISSHDVDGKDSIVGGSSSHYSREFAELMYQFQPWDNSYILFTIGLRAYFHQVTKVEPWLAIPACITQRLIQGYSSGNALSLFVSSGDGPVWPSISAGFRFDRPVHAYPSKSMVSLQLYYQYGASWAGTDAGAKKSTINLQMDVRGF